MLTLQSYVSGSNCINSFFSPPENIRRISEVPSCWRALEGAGEWMIKGTPLLVRRQYSGKCMLWCHSCIPVSQGSGKLSAWANSFFSPPTKSLGTRLEWYQWELLTVFLHFLQLSWPLLLILVVYFTVYVSFMPSQLQSGLIHFWLASFPGSCAEEEKRELGTHC